MCVCVHVCTYVCVWYIIYVCVYVCMCVCVYVCFCVYFFFSPGLFVSFAGYQIQVSEAEAWKEAGGAQAGQDEERAASH